ncbi:hypothetical protein EYB45_07555 [Erythrobacteraceae bacterium CFH 75059]|uniref:hypothetical protein n=1 Tax=Qipengyuania thermophila TaxID=2509361 RepID=UPI00101FC3AB|nr:hypothetical protein [Qipengyuania thermophila]TCD05325.1 hypothetical protein EYB45_07555 [Erythrobacteraceae bacterium CFH 75059]
MSGTEPQRGAPSRIAEGIHDWWRLAGVDQLYADEPAPLAAPPRDPAEDGSGGASATSAAHAENHQPVSASGPAARFGGEEASWPRNLAAFRQWWLDEPLLGERGAYPRIPPAGERGAQLMIVVPEPEAEDRDALLSGPLGQTCRHMLRAMQIDPASAYLASALPRHTPLADFAALAKEGLGDILRLHITLASPRQVLVLGRSLHPLLVDDPAVFCGPGLEELRRSALRRRRFWARWLEETEG